MGSELEHKDISMSDDISALADDPPRDGFAQTTEDSTTSKPLFDRLSSQNLAGVAQAAPASFSEESRTKTAPFDPADYLDTEDARGAYLAEALATGDPAFIADSQDVVTRARAMYQAAEKQAAYAARRASWNATVVRGIGERLEELKAAAESKDATDSA